MTENIQNLADLPEEGISPEQEVKKDSRNQAILSMNYFKDKYKFRFNMFTQRPEFTIINGRIHPFKVLNERDYDNLFNELKIDASIKVGRDDFRSLIGSDKLSYDYDPISEYLGSLPNWDKKDRFAQFLQQVQLKDEEQRPLLLRYFVKWFVSMVGSLIDDSCYNEYCFVFTGEQGRGKTRFFHSLVPKHLRLHYTFTGNFNPKDKDHEEMLGTKIIINLDEMGTMNRTDEETLKTTMSKRYVVLRRAYGRNPIHLNRKASFCGSHNRKEFLTDLTGNRRWLPFAIHNIDVDELFDISMLYSQSIAMYKQNYNTFMDRTEIMELEQHNEQFRYKSMEEEMIITNFRIPTEQEREVGNFIEYLTTTDIVHNLASSDHYKKLNVNDTVLKRFGLALSRAGFDKIKKRIPGKNKYPLDVWVVSRISSEDCRKMKAGDLDEFTNSSMI